MGIELSEKFLVGLEYKLKVLHRQYRIQVITHIVACGPVAKQRPRNKQLYNNRC
jgi:hypothetical protein